MAASSAQILKDASNLRMNSQKSTGAIHGKPLSSKQSNAYDKSSSINDIMSKYIKQGNTSGNFRGGEKSRNNYVVSSKTQSESMIKGGPSQK